MSYHEFSEQAAVVKNIDIEEQMQGTTATAKQNTESDNAISNNEGEHSTAKSDNGDTPKTTENT